MGQVHMLAFRHTNRAGKRSGGRASCPSFNTSPTHLYAALGKQSGAGDAGLGRHRTIPEH